MTRLTLPRLDVDYTTSPPRTSRVCAKCRITTVHRVLWDTEHGPTCSTRPEGVLICTPCRTHTSFTLDYRQNTRNTMSTTTADPAVTAEPATAEPATAVATPAATVAGTRTDLEATFKQHFRTVRFTTSIFEGKKGVKGVRAVVDGGDALDEDRVTHPRVALLPRAMTQEIGRARARIYGVLDRFTLPTQVKGSRLVAATNAEKFVHEFDAARDEFYRVADAVAAAHAEILEHNRTYWLPKFNYDHAAYEQRIGALIKTPEEIRGAFAVTITLDETAFGAAHKYADSAVNQFFAEAAQQRAEELRESVRAATEEPVRRLLEAINARRGRMTAQGEKAPHRADSFVEIRAALTLCQTCAAMLDPETTAQIHDVERFIDGLIHRADAARSAGQSPGEVIRRSADELAQVFDSAVTSCQNHLEAAAFRATFGVPRRGARYAS